MRECRMKEAPTYSQYWAAASLDLPARHYAAKHGGIPRCISMRIKYPPRKKLNDGNWYFIGRVEYLCQWDRDPLTLPIGMPGAP